MKFMANIWVQATPDCASLLFLAQKSGALTRSVRRCSRTPMNFAEEISIITDALTYVEAYGPDEFPAWRWVYLASGTAAARE